MKGYVTLYLHTGFNSVDIPATPSVLESYAANIVYPAMHFERMDVDLKSIDINAHYEDVRDCDYLKLTVQSEEPGAASQDFFYRCVPHAMAKGVVRMSLELDGLLTLGGAENLTYTSGWQERGHISKAEDTLFGNIVAESWVPSQELECKNTFEIKPIHLSDQIKKESGSFEQLTGDLNVVVSNIDLSDMGDNQDLTIDVVEGIVAGSQDASMYFPAIKTTKGTDSTTYIVHDYSTNPPEHSFYIPNSTLFLTSGASAATFGTDILKIKWGLDKLYSCGQLQLQSSYQIPKEYIDKIMVSDTKAGLIKDIKGYWDEYNLSTLPFEYAVNGYTVKNKKCFATYRTYAITAIASGETITKKASEIYQAGATNPHVCMWADPCSTGKPYARFKYIKGNPMIWQDAVRGTQWQCSQLVMEGASGSAWNTLNTSFANAQIDRNLSQQLFEKGVATTDRAITAANMSIQQNMLADQLGAAAGRAVGKAGEAIFELNPIKGTGAVMEFMYEESMAQHQSNLLSNETSRLEWQGRTDNARYEFAKADAAMAINKNGLDLLKNNTVVAPTVSFTPEQNLGLYGYNYFIAYEIRKTDEDLKSEDMYYQRYGYNGLHRPLTQNCFKVRDHYCYVQAFDINLKSPYNFGMRVNAVAIAQLNNGVRVWRDGLPDEAKYETN